MQDIINYIGTCKSLGYSIIDIKLALKSAGHSDDAINNAMIYFYRAKFRQPEAFKPAKTILADWIVAFFFFLGLGLLMVTILFPAIISTI